jgi:SAM-dependent methyltransferase
MAPELALQPLQALRANSLVLDPMSGSGTVLRHALDLGHRAIGFDVDPLAVLMARVWTSPIDPDEVERQLRSLRREAAALDLRSVRLPWIATSPQTREFINYWFARTQRRALTRIAYVLHQRRNALQPGERDAELNVLQLALSRIIVTKESGASLARDTSHSRPHRVGDTCDFDVNVGFERCVRQILQRAGEHVVRTGAQISIGDARSLGLRAKSVDAVITSPPYLNAIDYLRGHRLALVWLGYSLEELRTIRSNSIGAERAPDVAREDLQAVTQSMTGNQLFDSRIGGMIRRYAGDLLGLTQQVSKVLKPGGVATFVVGNSCLKGNYVDNARGLLTAAQHFGMTLVNQATRDLPVGSRYLPVTGADLTKRMRSEVVLTLMR